MAQTKNPIKDVIRNDSLTITATITDPDNANAPVNLDGYTAYLTVKSALSDLTANDDPGLMQIIVTPVNDPSGTGIVTFNCAPTDTNIVPGSHVYDVQVVSPSGSIYSSPEDVFKVNADVTRAT